MPKQFYDHDISIDFGRAQTDNAQTENCRPKDAEDAVDTPLAAARFTVIARRPPSAPLQQDDPNRIESGDPAEEYGQEPTRELFNRPAAPPPVREAIILDLCRKRNARSCGSSAARRRYAGFSLQVLVSRKSSGICLRSWKNPCVACGQACWSQLRTRGT